MKRHDNYTLEKDSTHASDTTMWRLQDSVEKKICKLLHWYTIFERRSFIAQSQLLNYYAPNKPCSERRAVNIIVM